jgi:hypothetical protein
VADGARLLLGGLTVASGGVMTMVRRMATRSAMERLPLPMSWSSTIRPSFREM